jgi:hypothetical protein
MLSIAALSLLSFARRHASPQAQYDPGSIMKQAISLNLEVGMLRPGIKVITS